MTLLPNKVTRWGTEDGDSASEFWGNTSQPGTGRQEETECSVVSQKLGGPLLSPRLLCSSRTAQVAVPWRMAQALSRPLVVIPVFLSGSCCISLVRTKVWFPPGSQALSPSRELNQNLQGKVLYNPRPFLCDSSYFLYVKLVEKKQQALAIYKPFSSIRLHKRNTEHSCLWLKMIFLKNLIQSQRKSQHNLHAS